jgi:hypothetical protein
MNYVRIDFENCGLDYDYTICKWHDVGDYINSVECDITESDPKEWEDFGKPSIKITPNPMSEADYEKWFTANVEDNA